MVRKTDYMALRWLCCGITPILIFISDYSMIDMSGSTRNTGKINRGIIGAIGAAAIILILVIAFVPLVTISYEEISQLRPPENATDEELENPEPVGRLVTKQITIYQMLTGNY